jgi:hypothetical protein
MDEEISLLTIPLSEIRKENRLYNFDKALRTTINRRYRSHPSEFSHFTRFRLWMTRGAWFQVIYLIMNTFQASLGTFSQSGMAFLEKEPPRIECLDDDSGQWRECSKEEVCGGNIPRDHYRYDES